VNLSVAPAFTQNEKWSVATVDLDLEHRDARLALGTLDDGSVIIALTRFDALGPAPRWGEFPSGSPPRRWQR
jgi:hypothetical protein